jgi:hypothetical protein
MLSISTDDFEKYLEDERQYLMGLKSEPLEETLKYQYVEALLELASAQLVPADLLLLVACFNFIYLGTSGNRHRKRSEPLTPCTLRHTAFTSYL